MLTPELYAPRFVGRRKAEKRKRRGAGMGHVALSEASLISPERSAELLDDALRKLSGQDRRKGQVIEMRYLEPSRTRTCDRLVKRAAKPVPTSHGS